MCKDCTSCLHQVVQGLDGISRLYHMNSMQEYPPLFPNGQKQGGYSCKNPPKSGQMVKNKGGVFLHGIHVIPNFFSPAAGFRSLFLMFSRFVARRRRKFLPFYASETRFYLRKSMFYCQNTKIFASRRSLSDRSQDVAKQGGDFYEGGEFLLEIPLM